MRARFQKLKLSIPLGTYMGIPLKLHLSMIILVLFVLGIGMKEHFIFAEYIAVSLLLIILFVCVTLHEYGHAYMASLFDIDTHDIILSPIGGVARLDHIPKDPKKELLIAIAGPLVNLAIFIALAIPIVILILADVISLRYLNGDILLWQNFLVLIAAANLGLFAFNLIPAFPMDGGRIFRSLLSMRTDHLTATRIASGIGKLLAIAGVVAGVWTSHPIWVLIGVFIFFMADMELNYLKKEMEFEAILAKHLVSRPVSYVYLHTPMSELIQEHFDINEKDFIVKNGFGKVAGIITINSLQEVMQFGTENDPAQNYVSQRYGIVNKNDNILQVINTMKTNDFKEVVVMDYGEIEGIIRVEDVNNKLHPNKKKQSASSKLIKRLKGAQV